MKPKAKQRTSFFKWLVKYKIRIALISFIVLLPTAFIVSLYVGDYLKYSSVIFDEEEINNFSNFYLTTENDTEHEEINLESTELLVKLKFKSYIVPEYIDETGNYSFRVKYVENGSYAVSNISVTMLLSTDWYEAKSNVKTFNPTLLYSSPQVLSFNHILPHSPLWFVTVEKPNLYVKVKYQVNLQLNQHEEKTHYFKVDLTKLTPSDVIDEAE